MPRSCEAFTIYTPSSPVQQTWMSDTAALGYFNHKLTSPDSWVITPSASPLSPPATSLRTTRRVKTSDGIAQSSTTEKGANTKAGRRQARLYDPGWRSPDAKGIDDTSGQRAERKTWPEDYGESDLDVLFSANPRSTPNKTPSTIPISSAPCKFRNTETKTTHGKSDSRSRLKEHMLQKNKLRLEMPPAPTF